MSDFRHELSDPHPALVAGILGSLSDDEKTAVMVAYAATMLPILDLSGRFRMLGLLNERSTLTELGRTVAQEIIRQDPEATDPHEET